jgi:hypothetical protein
MRRELVVVFGLPRSGSTWIYNVVRMLMQRRHGDVCAFYADEMSHVPVSALLSTAPLVVKTHFLPADPPDWLQAARVIVSVRDPRDAVVSCKDFLRRDWEEAAGFVARGGAALLAALEVAGQSMCLRYEDGAIGSADTIQAIAAFIGADIDAAQAEALARDMSSDAVRATIGRLQQAALIGTDAEPETFDPVTHWHPRHVGDGQVGKYRALLPAEAELVVQQNLALMRRFYQRALQPPLALPASLGFRASQPGQHYCAEGFSIPEDVGMWTLDGPARVVLPLAEAVQGRLAIRLTFLPYTTFMPDAMLLLHVAVEGVLCGGGAYGFASPPDPRTLSFLTQDLTGARSLAIEFALPRVFCPAELGLGIDERRLGILLQEIAIAPA